MMTVIRPPPVDAFICAECVRPSACDCPHRLCLTHAIVFYASLVRTGAALAFLTREVPIDPIRWLPLPAAILVPEPPDAPDEPDVPEETDPPDTPPLVPVRPIVTRWVSQQQCVTPGCENRRATRFGGFCDHHLYEARLAGSQSGVRGRAKAARAREGKSPK